LSDVDLTLNPLNQAMLSAGVSDAPYRTQTGEVTFPSINEFIRLQASVENLLKQFDSIVENAQRYFAEATVAITLAPVGSPDRVPTFSGVVDPVKALYEFTPGEIHHPIRHLRELTVNILAVEWNTQGGLSEQRMTDNVLNFTEITFGPNSSQKYEGFSWPIAELHITTLPTLNNAQWKCLEEEFGNNFFVGVLKNKSFEESAWGQIFEIFRGKGREIGIVVFENSSNDSTALFCCAGSIKQHSPYVVLELFQDSLREKMIDQPRQARGRFGRKISANPTYLADKIELSPFPAIYAKRMGLLDVSRELVLSAVSQEIKFGIPSELSGWFLKAVNSCMRSARNGDSVAFSTQPLMVAEDTLYELPEYFRNFVSAVEKLSDAAERQKKSKAKGLYSGRIRIQSKAVAVLRQLEQGLSDYLREKANP